MFCLHNRKPCMFETRESKSEATILDLIMSSEQHSSICSFCFFCLMCKSCFLLCLHEELKFNIFVGVKQPATTAREDTKICRIFIMRLKKTLEELRKCWVVCLTNLLELAEAHWACISIYWYCVLHFWKLLRSFLIKGYKKIKLWWGKREDLTHQ